MVEVKSAEGIWECEIDTENGTSMWVPLPDDVQLIMKNAADDGHSTALVKYNNFEYILNIDDMTQTNVLSKRARKLRVNDNHTNVPTEDDLLGMWKVTSTNTFLPGSGQGHTFTIRGATEEDKLRPLFAPGDKREDGIKRFIAVREKNSKSPQDSDSAELILHISSKVACDESGNIITFERATKHGGKVLKFTSTKATSKSPQLVEFWSREADPKPEPWLKSWGLKNNAP